MAADPRGVKPECPNDPTHGVILSRHFGEDTTYWFCIQDRLDLGEGPPDTGEFEEIRISRKDVDERPS